jgi:hypothetical protein
MSKTFFTQTLIHSYVNYDLDGKKPIEKALGGYELKTYDEFMKWWNNYPDHYTTRGRDRLIKGIENNFDRIFTSKCRDMKSRYIYDDIQSLSDNLNFDALFAIKKQDIILAGNLTIEQYQQQKSESIDGFIIVQKGECKKLPGSESSFDDVYSVNLICTNNVKGKLLIGAYLFILKTTPKAKVAILELLGGYTNIPGFIAYSKLGFKQDISLYGEDCFRSLSNLPMSKYFINETPDDIIKRVVGDVSLVYPEDISYILNFYESNKNNPGKQQKLGILLNILYRMELEPKGIVEDLISFNYDISIYHKMQDIFGYEETHDLIDVFYYNNTIYFDPKFVTEKDYDYEKCDNVDYRECYILDSAYPKIIERIKKYYETEIIKMLGENKIIFQNNINMDINGGKKLKTNKKHRHYKKKTSRNTKNKPKYKNKKLVKTRKNQKNKNY